MRKLLPLIAWALLLTPALVCAQAPPLSQLWKGEELWPFAGPGQSKYSGSQDTKDWRGMPGVVLGFSYSGTGPLPAPKELVIQLDKRLPLGPPYRLFVKNFYRGKMEATVGDVTKPLEVRRFDWTPGVVFEPNQIEGFDRIVLRYFPSAMVADTGVAQTQLYIVQGVFLTTEVRRVPIKGGEILETITEVVPPAKAGNYLENGSFEVGLFPWGKPFGASAVYNSEDLDRSTATDGATSFRHVLTRPTGRAAKDGSEEPLLETRNYLLPPGSYTLSFHAKADQPMKLSARLNGASEDLKTSASTSLGIGANLTNEWQEYKVRAEVKALPGYLYSLRFSLASPEPGTVWLDAVQLANGDGAPFQPAHTTEVGYACATPGHIFYTGDDSRADLLISDSSDATAVKVAWRVIDYWGAEVARAEKEVPMARHRGRLAVKLPARKTGLFRVLWSAGESRSEMLYSVVPANPHLTGKYPEGTLGADAVFEERQLAILKRANFNWVSSKSLARWPRVERERGQFTFDDAGIAAADRAGMMILLQPLNLAGEVKTYQPWLAPSFRPPKNTGAPWTERGVYMSAWGDFIEALVGHFKGSVQHWEIENEPNAGYLPNEYAELLQVAIDRARRADPAAKIVAFAGGGFRQDFYEPVLQRVDPRQIDVLSLHVYGNGESAFAPFRALLQKHGKPGWNTETGATCPTFFTTLPEYEALRTKDYWEGLQRSLRATTASQVTNYLQSMSDGGMERYFFYFARFVNAGPSQPTSRFGGGKELVEFDGTLRASGVALCLASHFLDGATYHAPAALAERLQAHVFQKGTGAVGFLLGHENPTLTLTPPVGMSFFDIMGNRVEEHSVTVSDSPVYFTFSGNAPECAMLLGTAKVARAP